MKRILFLCTGNSCRSQMAEGWARHLISSKAEFYSAGTSKHGLNPRAVEVMHEVGVDISIHESKTLEDLSGIDFDKVYTVCEEAHQNCPIIIGVNVQHVGFVDPPRQTAKMTNEQQVLSVYRTVRDEIRVFIENLSI